MKLNELPKLKTKTKTRLGRGYGSGKGAHTSTRGQKGQKSRSKIPQWFTGTSWVWFKRLPMIKGKGKFKSIKKDTLIIKLSDIDRNFKDGDTVDMASILKKGIITEKQSKTNAVKVLNSGKLTKKIKLKLPATKSVIQTVKKIGGEYISETE